MSPPKLILASGSPRRRELLTDAGYDFVVVRPRDGAEPEGLCSNCGPAQLVVDLALAKLTDVLDQLASDRVVPEASDSSMRLLVLAADTVAECGGQILGKPRDEEHASQMMQMLSGRDHRVYTGVALAEFVDGASRQLALESVVTHLRMNDLSQEWIDGYAESGSWQGKAGGFGYQDGLGFVHITSGSESNVVGLPMEHLEKLLGEHGVELC